MKIFKLIFLASVFLSIIVSFTFYLSWNNYRQIENPTFSRPIDQWHIDQCTLTTKELRLSGWAINLKDSNSRVRLYVQKKHSEDYIKIHYTITPRTDVSRAYDAGNKYDKSGFIASIANIPYQGGLSKKLVITSIDKNGIISGENYECK